MGTRKMSITLALLGGCIVLDFRNTVHIWEITPSKSIHCGMLLRSSRQILTCDSPVFESLGQRCLGVLEFITSTRLNLRCDLVLCLERLYKALEEVGLTSPDISLSKYFLLALKLHVNHAEKEIKEGLKTVRKTHNIPFAQTWVAQLRRYNGETIFDASKNLFYKVSEKYSSFRGVCKRNRYINGTGVVGKAFSSLTSSFCKDVSRLSEKEYSLAHQARKVNLTSCFAICLRSPCTGFSVYTLEFFLPIGELTARKEPWTHNEASFPKFQNCLWP